MAASAKLCHHVHIPLQSGDNQILQRMGRHYTVGQYVDFIEYAISAVPRLGIGTDVLTGFPGETEENFKNTADLIKKLPFSNLHVFPYSKRPGTRATSMPDQIDQKISKIRAKELIMLGERKKREFGEKFIGNEVSVLIENISGNTGTGWTDEYLQAETSFSPIKTNEIVSFTPSFFAGNILR